MQRVEFGTDYKVNANHYQRLTFSVNEKQRGFKIAINAKISETDKNIIFHLSTYDDSQKLIKWLYQRVTYRKDANGQIMKTEQGYPVQVAIPRPQINDIINLKTNILEKNVSLPPGVYALMFDNTYSAINSKNVRVYIVETWDEDVPTDDLSIMKHLVGDLPDDVATCVIDANDCFTHGHYNQCSVMLRKAIEIAIKIKIQQRGIDTTELLDKSGNELNLSGRIKFLKEHRLITQRTVSDIEKVKWFGDVGAHGTMKVTIIDIKDIEPKVRNFLTALNLKV